MNPEILHLKELIEQYNVLTQRAIDKAEGSMNKRLEGMNEFREQMADMIARLATNERVDSLIQAIKVKSDNTDKELGELKQWKANIQGRMAVVIILWPILVGVVVFILSHYFK